MVDATMDPSLRQRFSLYPSQFICAVVLVSLGPLLDSMMRDLDIPLRRGGLISAAGLFLGEVVGIVILNTHMAKVPAKWALVAGAALQGAGLIAVGAGSWNLWCFFAAYLFVGLGWALLNTIGWMWVPAHIRKGTAAAALLMILFFALGMMLTPLVLGLAIDLGATWRWIIIAEGGVSLLLALGIRRLAPAGHHRPRERPLQSHEAGGRVQSLVARGDGRSLLHVRGDRDQPQRVVAEVPARHLRRRRHLGELVRDPFLGGPGGRSLGREAAHPPLLTLPDTVAVRVHAGGLHRGVGPCSHAGRLFGALRGSRSGRFGLLRDYR